jgi:hypothetical protein
MTLAPSDRYVVYNPSVDTTDFIVPYPIFSDEDLRVTINGDDTDLFTVNATFVNGRAEGAVVVLSSAVVDIPVEIIGARVPRRDNRYRNNSPDLAENVQQDMDALTAVLQEQVRVLDRIPALPDIAAAAAATQQAIEAALEAVEAAEDAASVSSSVVDAAAAINSTPIFGAANLFGYFDPQTGDNRTALQAFLNGASTFSFNFLRAGVAKTRAVVVSSVSGVSIEAAQGANVERVSNEDKDLLTFEALTNSVLKGLRLNGFYGNFSRDGHGIELTSPQQVTIDGAFTQGFGGAAATNGGVGLLAYPDAPTSFLDDIVVMNSRFDGSVTSEKSFGVVLDNARMSMIHGCFAQGMSQWGLEFKNDAIANLMVNSRGHENLYSFGFGFEADQDAESNIIGNVVSLDSDQAVSIGSGRYNLVNGAIARVDAHPDFFESGHAYGVNLEVPSSRNVVLGLVASGSAMTFPARVRSSYNVVEVADYSTAGNVVTFDDGAGDNLAIVLHMGDKANSVKGRIEDQNATPIGRGPGANVVSSPLTGERYGSTQDRMVWGMDGFLNDYQRFSTASFAFEGFEGETKLGLGVKPGRRGGIVIDTEDDGGEEVADITWQDRRDNVGALSYWRVGIDQVSTYRFDAQAIAPVVDKAVDLGKSGFEFGRAFIENIRLRPSADVSSIPLENGHVVIGRISDQSLAFIYRGLDGVTRQHVMTFAV